MRPALLLFLLLGVETARGTVLPYCGYDRLAGLGAAPAGPLPELANNRAPIAQTQGERSLTGWRTLLTPDQRDAALLRAVENNSQWSRTATLGRSNKGFALTPEEVRRRALVNLHDALEQTTAAARRPLGDGAQGPEEIYRPLTTLNGLVTRDLSAVLRRGDTLTPGELRWVPAQGDPNTEGRTPERIRRENELALREFSRELYFRLRDPAADPIETATWAYLTLSEGIKPFADGNGRTGMALVNYILLRADYPVPTLSTLGHRLNPVTMDHEGGGFDEAIRAWRRHRDSGPFRRFLDESVKETIRLALRDRPVTPAELESAFRGHEAFREEIRPLGEGRNGRAYLGRAPDGAPASVKVALSYGALANLRAEAELTRFLAAGEGISARHLPRLLGAHLDGFWLAKEYVEGPNGWDLLDSGRPLTARQMRELESLYGQIQELARRHSVYIDFKPANVVWSAERNTWVLIDLGPAYYEAPAMTLPFAAHFEANWRP